MASTYLTRTPSSTGNKQIFTFSAWVKRSLITSDKFTLLGGYNGDSDTGYFDIRFLNLTDRLNLTGWDSNWQTTTRVFRDVNAWYHIVYAIDTTQATPSNRIKLYINGIQETAFDVDTEVNRNLNFPINTSGTAMIIGRSSYTPSPIKFFNGSMSYVALVDGTQELPTIFGETDSVTGQWKIKTDITPSVAWGTNGFLILKNGNSLTDESTNTNNFTLGGGTLTNTLDCPDNVFCTINPLNSYWAGGTFSNGNNTVVLPNKSGAWNTGTLGMTSGKYYWEIKSSGTGGGEETQLGIADKSPTGNTGSGVAGTAFGINSNGEYGIYAYNGAFIGNGVSNPYTSYGSSTANGIAMFAVDLDNNKFYGGLNGTWFASGNPATGANGKTIQAVADTQDGCYYPAVGTYQGYTGTAECNFGNGYFGTTAVTSAGTAGSTPGTFEYDVPSGYQPLSTKGLNA